jgi:hypothetical protein
MKTLRIVLVTTAFLGLDSGWMYAQNWDTVQTSGPSPQIEIWTYLEPYFAYDLNEPASKNLPFLYNFSRHNEFNLNLALIELDYQGQHMRAIMGMQTGTYPLANYGAEPSLLQHIYQAFGGVEVTPDLWIDAGVFSSHFGIETAIGKDQWTLTRSLCAENSPYFETGVRAAYDPDGPMSFGLFVLNGWQNIADPNSNKALGTQIQYTIANKLTLNSSIFYGNEKPDNAKQWRIFHDFYVLWYVTDDCGLSGVFDIGWQQSAPHSNSYNRWYTFSLIGHYLFTTNFGVGVRAEQFNDPNGVIVSTGTPNGYQILGLSANLDYIVSDHATFRLEAKHYSSKDNIFMKNGTPESGSLVVTSALAVTF